MSHMTTSLSPFRSLALLAAVALVGCSDGAIKAGSGSTAAAAPETRGAGACSVTGSGVAKQLLKCTDRSIVYIENHIGTGTGVLVEFDKKTYVLTNAHVVDPAGFADLALGGDGEKSIPVLGAVALADIALLGPLKASAFDGTAKALTVSKGDGLDRGDEVYLVGYPGESDDPTSEDDADLETTITSGIVSRSREVKEFGQRFIQTDASISGGQSGGPLFDAKGRIVGISGLSFAEEFALALSGEDVMEAADAIIEGDADKVELVPDRVGDRSEMAAATSGKIELDGSGDVGVLYVPRSDRKRTLELSFTSSVRFVAYGDFEPSFEPAFVSAEASAVQNEVGTQMAARTGGSATDFVDPSLNDVEPSVRAAEVSPNSFRFDIPADEAVYAYVGTPLTAGASTVEWASSEKAYVMSPPAEQHTMKPGETIDRVATSYQQLTDVSVTLEAGDSVELYARSPQSDVAIIVIPPSVAADPLVAVDPDTAGGKLIDDSGKGLYDSDAQEVFTAKESGVHRIRVGIIDGYLGAFRFSVGTCRGEDDCTTPSVR